MMQRNVGGLLTIVMALLVATGAQAISDSWKADASGSWDFGDNWTGGNVPGTTTSDNTDVATFGVALTTDASVLVDVTRYIGGISFGNASAYKYTLNTGTLYLNNGGVIQTLSGNGNHADAINAAIQISGTSAATAFFTANASSASSLLSIGAVSGSATSGNTTTLTLNGANAGANAVTGVISDGSGGGKLTIVKDNILASWTLSGANTYTGGTTINAGTFNVYGDQSAATGGWAIGPVSYTNLTCNFLSGSTIVVPAGKKIQIGNTTSGGMGYPVVNVAGTVTNRGALLIGRGVTINLNSGAMWTQEGDMSLTGYGGRVEYLYLNSGATFSYGGTNSIKVDPASGSSGGSLLTIKGVFNTKQGFERTLPVSGGTVGSGKISISSGGQLKLTGPVADLTINATNKPLVFALESGGGIIDTDTNNTSISTVVSGTGTLTKKGTGTLALSATNTLTGAITNNAGTLKLTGGDNRLKNTGTLIFSGTAALDVETNSQTLATVVLPDEASTATFKGNGGALIVNGTASLEMGPGGAIVGSPLITVDMTELSRFIYDSVNATFRVGLKNTVSNTSAIGQIATVTLASTNTIRAQNFCVGDKSANSDGGASTLHLGQKNTLSVGTINTGYSGRSDVIFDFAAGLSNPMVTIRNTDGSSPVSNWGIGSVAQFSNSPPQSAFVATADFSAGTLDALVTAMTIGTADAGAQSGRVGTQNSFFFMKEGTLEVTTLAIGKIANTGGNGTTTGTAGGTYRGNGTFALNGGTVSATTVTMAENTISDVSSHTKSTSGTFILSNGTLRASTVQKGPQTATAISSTTFRWVAGTIGNISGSDLIWTNIPLTLQTEASHVFDVKDANTATFDANSVISGSGCGVTKIGIGTLKLCAANTYSGGTIVSNGTLVAGCDNALASGSALTLNGSTFDAGSYANTLGMLTLSDATASQLLVNSGNCTLSFTGMDGTGTLDISGTLASTSVQFGASDSALTPEQLSRITVNGEKTFLSTRGYLRELIGTKIILR